MRFTPISKLDRSKGRNSVAEGVKNSAAVDLGVCEPGSSPSDAQLNVFASQ